VAKTAAKLKKEVEESMSEKLGKVLPTGSFAGKNGEKGISRIKEQRGKTKERDSDKLTI